ncbi:MAG: M23 family metallopeptidase [Candidatus Aminicenantes bacterium]|nr:M23 family metallopeptidase [Candidatus Aminicenantes bacterium]
MRSKNKSYSIIIVSDATSTNKELFLSSKFIRNSLIAVVLLVALFGYVIFDYLTLSIDNQKMGRLEVENERKTKIISELTRNVDKAQRSLTKMENFKKRILIAAGLTSPSALQEIGTGGGPIADISTDVELIDSNLDLTMPKRKVDILEKSRNNNINAKKMENDLQFVENVIDKQKVRLASTPSIWPTKGYLTNSFGRRIHPLTGKRSFHYGQDIATQSGNKVIAPANGVILVAEYRDYYGKMVIIDHNFGYTSRYGHLAAFNVKEGDRVTRGQVIGFVGNTGRSTAPHLHYEVRFMGKAINPMNFIID